MRRTTPTNFIFRTSHFALRPSFILLLLALFIPVSLSAQSQACIIITSLGGMPEYEENFTSWGNKIENTFKDDLGSVVFRLDGREQRRDEVLRAFNEVSSKSFDQIWVFLIGHANYDGRQYKFNIIGPDITGEDLKKFLDTVSQSRTFIVAGTSASGILASELAGDNRVIVTATRSPQERQPPLFMSFFAEAASSPEADTNKDGKVSLLEAFLFSQARVEEWFEEKGRIQTEHALLNDRGQVRLGERSDSKTPAEPGMLLASTAYVSAPPEQEYRSAEAQQLAAQGQEIEREIEDLKFRKTRLPESEYYGKLEQLLVQLATIHSKIEELENQ